MRNYRHSKKHNEFPSFIDFLEGNDTGPFSRVSSDHHPSKPWITVIARK